MSWKYRKEEGGEKPPEQPEPVNWKAELIDWAKALVFALVVGLVLVRFIIISAYIPTGSMQNTINPGDRVIGLRLTYLVSEPQRGDIVVFKFPDDESQNYVKRIIGLPGETVQMKNGVVYLNGQPLEEEYLREAAVGDTEVFTVPEDCYFMMGDNRNYSHDSRKWTNHFVKREKILGKVYFRYWPGLAWLA